MLHNPGDDLAAAWAARNEEGMGTVYLEASEEFLAFLRETLAQEGAAFLCITDIRRRVPSPLAGRAVFAFTVARRPEEERAMEQLAARLWQAFTDLGTGRYHPLAAADIRRLGDATWTETLGAREGRPAEEQLAAFLQRIRYIVAEELAGKPLPKNRLSDPAGTAELLQEAWEALESGRPLPLTPHDVGRLAADWRRREKVAEGRLMAAGRVATMAAAMEKALQQRAEALAQETAGKETAGKEGAP